MKDDCEATRRQCVFFTSFSFSPFDRLSLNDDCRECENIAYQFSSSEGGNATYLSCGGGREEMGIRRGGRRVTRQFDTLFLFSTCVTRGKDVEGLNHVALVIARARPRRRATKNAPSGGGEDPAREGEGGRRRRRRGEEDLVASALPSFVELTAGRVAMCSLRPRLTPLIHYLSLSTSSTCRRVKTALGPLPTHSNLFIAFSSSSTQSIARRPRRKIGDVISLTSSVSER